MGPSFSSTHSRKTFIFAVADNGPNKKLSRYSFLAEKFNLPVVDFVMGSKCEVVKRNDQDEFNKGEVLQKKCSFTEKELILELLLFYAKAFCVEV